MFIVTYKGKFGFIKPWMAVRDVETYSQQFLTPSVIEGIEKKLFPEMLAQEGVIKHIARHKLVYDGIDIQQEQTQARGWNVQKARMERSRSILKRGVLLNPVLKLAFDIKEDADIAVRQHICLCRNEDILWPEASVIEMTEKEFSLLEGFELRFGESEQSFLVGYNRFDGGKPMYGWIEIGGQSILAI